MLTMKLFPEIEDRHITVGQFSRPVDEQSLFRAVSIGHGSDVDRVTDELERLIVLIENRVNAMRSSEGDQALAWAITINRDLKVIEDFRIKYMEWQIGPRQADLQARTRDCYLSALAVWHLYTGLTHEYFPEKGEFGTDEVSVPTR